MSEKPKWNGGFEAARRIAEEIVVPSYKPEDYSLVDKIAEALVEAFDDGVYAECCERGSDPEINRMIFTKVLREHGIGIATLDKMEAYTRAVARGEAQPAPDEPKLWFSSIEALVTWIKAKSVGNESRLSQEE